MALFGQMRDISMFRFVNRELMQKIISQQCVFYKYNSTTTKVKMYGEYHKVAIPNVSSSSTITGAIIHIPEEMVPMVDEYEGLEYKKVNIKTLSDLDCIMYVKR